MRNNVGVLGGLLIGTTTAVLTLNNFKPLVPDAANGFVRISENVRVMSLRRLGAFLGARYWL